jgi:drug/metabolite transporter (DMT)-like permease
LTWRNSVPYIEVAFAVAVWGASFIATKLALRQLAPPLVVWLRFFLGLLVLGLAAGWQRHRSSNPHRLAFAWPRRHDWGYLALLGFLGITLHQWLQSNGLVTAQATTTAWIVATTPVFIALLGWLFLGERLGWLNAGGILLAAAGVLVVVSRGDLRAIFSGGFGAPGDWLILASAPNWAVFSVLSRRGLKAYPATWLLLFVVLLGFAFTSLLLVLSGPSPAQLAHLSLTTWAGLAFLGIFCSGLAYIAWYAALQALPASQVGAFLYLEPLVTAVTAALVLGEGLRLPTWLGGGVILLGVWLVQRQG